MNAAATAADPLATVERIADEVFSPDAAEVDRSGVIPDRHLEALAEARLFGAFAPRKLGGAGLDAAEISDAVELLASGCLASTFVWIQHFGALGALLGESTPSSLRDRFLADLIAGRRRAGIALGGLQQPGLLRAKRQDGGWEISGLSPWVTGWPYIDLLLAVARTPSDDLVTALVDLSAVEGVAAEPQRLAAADASGTVRLEVNGLHIDDDSVVSVAPYDPAKAAGEGLRVNGSLALGIARRCCRLIGPSPLDDELARCREALNTAGVHEMPAARAAASALALRAAALVSVAEGSSAALAGGEADRLSREATFTLVFGSRPAIKANLRDRLADCQHPTRPFEPQAVLSEMTTLVGPWAVRVAATLRLPDLVASGCGSPEALATAAGADTAALERLMRFLTAAGVFRVTEDGSYAPTTLSALIEDKGPGCTRDWLDIEGAGGRMDMSWPSLLHSVKTGTAGYPAFFGRGFWEDLDGDERLAESFRRLMEGHARSLGPALAADVDWRCASSVVDVGAGTGQLLAGLLENQPQLVGLLVDLPATADVARAALADAGLIGRCHVVGQSFFDPLPAGHTYLLSWILHDWDDDHALVILRNCRQAMQDHGRVILVEHAAAEAASVPVTGMDLRMLSLFASRERNLDEYDRLCAAAGLRRVQVAPVDGEIAALVYVPA